MCTRYTKEFIRKASLETFSLQMRGSISEMNSKMSSIMGNYRDWLKAKDRRISADRSFLR
jgi:hypothetical protein